MVEEVQKFRWFRWPERYRMSAAFACPVADDSSVVRCGALSLGEWFLIF
jgi:hypothetical protein